MAKKKEEETEEQDPLETLRMFVIQSKVTAFAYAYDPCDNELEADEVFTDQKLRKYFNAYPKTAGDPLMIYVDEHLYPLGFRMMHSAALGEPAIFVKCKM